MSIVLFKWISLILLIVALFLSILLVYYFFKKNKPVSTDYEMYDPGYYHAIYKRGSGIRCAWHEQKFNRLLNLFPKNQRLSICDVGCAAGSLLSELKEEDFKMQIGVDISNTQIQYARKHFETDFRKFVKIDSFKDVVKLNSKFNYITSVELIEHLEKKHLYSLFNMANDILESKGSMILTTPNYTSLWPALEILLNTLFKINYLDQHITRFNFFTFEKKISTIYPDFHKYFKVDFVTSTHFIAPYLAIFSNRFAASISSMLNHSYWKLPFGALLLVKIDKK